MKLTPPLVFGVFVFVLALCGAVYFLGNNDTQARDALGLARAARNDFSALEVTRGTTTVRIEQGDEGWSLNGELIDVTALTSFRKSLVDASVQLVARSGRMSAAYGLGNPTTLTFVEGETRTSFELGAIAYTTGGIHVARQGEDAVYLVTESDEISKLSLDTFTSWKVAMSTPSE